MCPGVKLGLDSHRVTGVPPTPRSQPSLRQLGRECGQGMWAGVWLGLSPGQSFWPKTPPLPPTSFWDLRGEGGNRAGGGRVRLLCLCKSVCWCIYGPVCVFLCDYRAQLSMAPLWPGLSLFICSVSRCAPSLPSGRLWKHALGCFCAPASASASLALPHTSAGRRERASSFLGSVRVFVSPSTCELRGCVSQSLGAGGSQRPCLAAPSPGPNLGPAVARARPLAALGRGSVRAARAGPGEARCSPARRPLPGLLARWLSRSLARSLGLSALALPKGAGWGAGAGGGEAPAFLRSGRNLSQRYWSPEEPSCSPGAPPALSLPARACWDGHGLGLELGAGHRPYPRPPFRLGAQGQGSELGAGRQGVPRPPGEGRAWGRESPPPPGA